MKGRELLELVGRLAGLSGAELRDAGRRRRSSGPASADAADRRIGTYSGGMRQRLGIAQAVLHEPELLILDEPVSSLDPEGRRDLLALIESLAATATVVVSTHVLADVERICDRVAILDRGRLVTEGPLAELLEAHARPIFRLVPALGQGDGGRRARGAPAGCAVDQERRGRRRRHPRRRDGRGRGVARDPAARRRRGRRPRPRSSRREPTLEDVFLELVGPGVAGRARRPRVSAAARGGRSVTGFGVLLRKELLEQWRTLRLPVIAAVFVLIGLGSPLLARFTPELVEALGGAQFQIVLPPPTTADAVDQLIKNVSQFGILVAVLLAMGSVATEKERGTAGLILTKPASRGAFLVREARRDRRDARRRDVPRGGGRVVLHAGPVRGTPRRRVRGLGRCSSGWR